MPSRVFIFCLLFFLSFAFIKKRSRDIRGKAALPFSFLPGPPVEFLQGGKKKRRAGLAKKGQVL
jgi:hypothetical protein